MASPKIRSEDLQINRCDEMCRTLACFFVLSEDMSAGGFPFGWFSEFGQNRTRILPVLSSCVGCGSDNGFD
jgi:hypothetical protein